MSKKPTSSASGPSENAFLEKARRDARCGICRQIVREPVLLPCLHSVCRTCADENVVDPDVTIVCSVCGGVHRLPGGSSSLIRDRALSVVAERLRNSYSGTCAECGKMQSMYHCTQCSASLCSGCNSQIHALRINQSHSSVRISEDVFKLPSATCHYHKDKPLEMYCMDCAQPVCSYCMLVGQHRQHTGQTLSDAYQHIAAEQQQLLKQLETHRALVESLHSGTERKVQQTQVMYGTLVALVQHHLAAARRVLDDAESSAVQQLTSLRDQKLEVLQHKLDESSAVITHNVHAATACTQLLHRCDAADSCTVHGAVRQWLQQSVGREVTDAIAVDAESARQSLEQVLDDVWRCTERVGLLQGDLRQLLENEFYHDKFDVLARHISQQQQQQQQDTRPTSRLSKYRQGRNFSSVSVASTPTVIGSFHSLASPSPSALSPAFNSTTMQFDAKHHSNDADASAATALHSELKVTVLVQGSTVSVRVNSYMVVRDMKLRIAELTGLNADEQILRYDGAEMKDASLVAAYGIRKEGLVIAERALKH